MKERYDCSANGVCLAKRAGGGVKQKTKRAFILSPFLFVKKPH